MGSLARRQWRKRPNLTWDRPANPMHERSSYDALNGRSATIMDGAVVRDPLWGSPASSYDGSHVSTDVRNILDKFGDEIRDKIRRKANTEPAVRQEKVSPWNPWDPNV